MNALRPCFRFATLLLLAVVALGGKALAQTTTVPATLAYQGYLTDGEGQPLAGDLPMVFALHHAPQGGSPVWQESHAAVPVRAGFFQVELGILEPLGDGLFDGPLFLGIRVDGDPELVPRSVITSLPFARRAGGMLACGLGETNCGGLCANLQADDDNCGSCGTACPAGQSCSGGGCLSCTPTTWYRDADGDGYGNCDDSIQACWPQGEYNVDLCSDCDDSDPDIFPGAPGDVCQGDGIDNDCDGEIDQDPSSCFDGNSCTMDVCSVGMCSFQPEADGTPCESGTCFGGMCVADAACDDGEKNGDETDVDCGGSVCQACVAGGACLVGSDCQSGTCNAGFCE